ncbi:enoyl-CoA hydratase/isomerase family protein [Caballeronia hypogeia]|nr:enoyl-CoA hydratase-related protein [Caballeronia hypogeia]
MPDTNLVSNASSDAVLTQVIDGILIVTINHAPVNALSVPVRQRLMAAIERANSDSDVRGVAIVGSGRAFCGGADIREFGKPVSLWTRQVCAAISGVPESVKMTESGEKTS